MSHPSLWAFAVEPDRVQVTWRHLGAGPARFTAGEVEVSTELAPGPGALTITGLPADRALSVRVEPSGRGADRRPTEAAFRTPPALPGPELCRFATVSDLHLGEHRFGYFGTMHEHGDHDEPYSVRATSAALQAALAWGADAIVFKGDLTASGRPDQWKLVRRFVSSVPVPVLLIPGNHDNHHPDEAGRTAARWVLWLLSGGPIRRLVGPARTGGAVSGDEGLAIAGHPMPGPVVSHDLPGVRLVAFDSTVRHRHIGSAEAAREALLAQAADAAAEGRALWVAGHHPAMRFDVPLFWPPGIPGSQARSLLADLRRRNPRVVYTAGHTHRNRRYERAGVTCTEVGSPKDYPGTWAGYVVHEHGIRQVVYRVDDPDVLPWLDRSRGAAFGLWGRWSPGRIEDRCFTLPW